MRHIILLLTLVGATLLACSGVVLAQATTPGTKQPTAQEERSTGQESTTDQRPPGSKAPLEKHDSKSAIPGQYIVVLKDDQAPGINRSAENDRAPDKVAKEHEDVLGAEVKHVYKNALKGYAAKLSDAQLEEVRSDDRVLFVSEDREVRAFADEQTPTGVKRIGGSELNGKTNNGSGVGVAVIDTGIDLTHPDLSGVQDGKNCLDPSKSANDDSGHGTHVAGTIAARKNNGVGAVGVAPEATPYAVKVLNAQGSGSWSDVACGIDWVTANAASKNIKVANMSLGGDGSDDNNCGNSNSDALHRAICNSVAAGVTYAVAAGNVSGADEATKVPAAYNEALTVTALADFDGQPGGGARPTCRSDVDDTAADFSNLAVSSADQEHTIAAPGVCIYSTWMNGGYNTISGTSMATPHVAGTAALYLANDPVATPTQVITSLREDAKLNSDPSANPYYGFKDDPTYPNGSRYYGYLEWPGGYFGNTNPLRVSEVHPSDGAEQVPLATNVTATFSRVMKPDTLTSNFTLAKDDGKPVGATVSCDEPCKTVTLKPSDKLEADKKYTATLKGGPKGATDEAGNPLASDKVWSFTTTDDATPPTVVDVHPSDGATQVAFNTNVTATFSEAMDPSTLTTSNFTLAKDDGTSVEATVSYDEATKKVKLNPSANLEVNTKYTATVKGGTSGVKDKVGNPLASDKIWSFTTTDDTTPPTVTENSPTGRGDVSRDTNVTVKFSKDVRGVTADTFMLAKGPSEPTPTTKLGSGTTVSYDPATQTATLDPYGSSGTRLESCARYTAKATSGITDRAGNPLKESVWTFKTRGC